MSDNAADQSGLSPVLSADWSRSRWGPDDQRGNGNLMTPKKVLEAVGLIKTGEIVSLGMPYDARMPLAPGRAYALRMPGGPTGGLMAIRAKRSGTMSSSPPKSARSAPKLDALRSLGKLSNISALPGLR